MGNITVSLKHETYWKHHIEAEIVVDTKEKIPTEKKELNEFFKKLSIAPMIEEENKALVNTVLKKFDMELL